MVLHHRFGDVSPVQANTARDGRARIPPAARGASTGPPGRSRHVTCGNDEDGSRNGAAGPGRAAAPASGLRLRYKSFQVSDKVLLSVEPASLDELDRFPGGVELGG